MRRAIIAGRGALPGLLHAAHPTAVFVTIEGVAATPPADAQVISARFEKLGRLFSDLRAAGVTEVAMAGAMDRPALNPGKFDLKMAALAPGLLKAFRQGDDGLLRKVVSIFEGEGFRVVGPLDIAPALAPAAGPVAGPKPGKALVADAAKAGEVLAALAPLDVGQAAVVAAGQVLGIETIQGTDALLDFVAATPAARRPAGGALVKGPKAGQDMRVDVPTIGPETIDRAVAARLSGVCLAAGGVLVLEPGVVHRKAAVAGLSLWAVPWPR